MSQTNFHSGLGTETVGSGDKRIMLAVVAVPEVNIINQAKALNIVSVLTNIMALLRDIKWT